MGYMNKQPSILVKDNMHEGQTESWRTFAVKDNTVVKGNYYCVGVGDIGKERCSGRDAQTVWVGK